MRFALLIYESPEAFAPHGKAMTRPLHGRMALLSQGSCGVRRLRWGDPLQVLETGTSIRIQGGEAERTGWSKNGLRFTHVGLVPVFEYHCGSSSVWGFVVGHRLRARSSGII
jgi:hypothetical protein